MYKFRRTADSFYSGRLPWLLFQVFHSDREEIQRCSFSYGKKRFKIDFDIWYNLYRIKVVTSRVGAAEDVQMRSEHSIDGFHRKQGILAAVE